MDSTDSFPIRWRWGGWILVLWIAWGIWLWNLNLADLTFDETATYFVAYRSPLEILQYLLGAAQEHPPVYYLILRGWMALTGTGEFALRYFSLLVGLVALALVGWLVRILMPGNRRSGLVLGLVTALLLTFTPSMAYYARNARMYALVMVWAILAAGLLWRDWVHSDAPPRWTAVLALMLVNGLALFTHYYFILFIVTQPLILLAVRRWRNLGMWLIVHSIPALVGGLWLLLATGLQKTLGNVVAEFGLALPKGRQVALFLGNLLASPLETPPVWLLWVLLALLTGGIVVLWRREWRGGVWLLLLLVVPFVLAYVLPREPQARYLIYLLPFAALAIAFVLTLPAAQTKWRGWGVGASLILLLPVAGLLANSGMTPVLTSTDSRYGQTLAFVKANVRPGDEVLFYGPWQVIPFRYYNPGGLPAITVLPERAPPLLDPAQAAPVLADLLARVERLWVVPTAVSDVDPDLFVWGWLRQQAHAVLWQGDVQLFLPPLPDTAVTIPTNLLFGSDLMLEQIQTDAEDVAAGDGVRLTLYWQPAQLPMPAGKTTLSLVDSSGRAWQTMTAPLPISDDAQMTVQRTGLVVPAGTPPGEYRLQLRVLDETGAVLRVAGEEQATLHSFAVTEPSMPPVLLNVVGNDGTVFCPPDGGACVTLARVEPGGVNFQPGYPVPLTLHWLAPERPLPPLSVRLQVQPNPWLGGDEAAFVEETLPLTPDYGAENWSSGRLVTLPTTLFLPVESPVGRAKVTVAVADENGRTWTTPAGSDTFDLFPITVEARPTLRRLPAGLARMEADFGDEIGVRGYRVAGSACPGSELTVTYAWYARERPSTIYAVFNHLVTADETPVAQVDSWPQGGRLLTTQWQPGEYIEDSYTLTIPADAPAGPYMLYIGFYQAADGMRLPAFQDGQRIPTDRVVIPVENDCE